MAIEKYKHHAYDPATSAAAGQVFEAGGRRCVDLRPLTEAGLIGKNTVRSYLYENKEARMGSGEAYQDYVADYDRIPSRWRGIVDRYNPLALFLCPSPSAESFFNAYKVDDRGLLLPPDKVRLYASEAAILDGVRDLRQCLAPWRTDKSWAHVRELVGRLDPEEWPHAFAACARTFQRKAAAYEAGGYAALVHGGFGNRNARSTALVEQGGLLLDLVSDPRNLSAASVTRIFNARSGQPPVSVGTVRAFRQEHEQDIFARRFGGREFRAKRSMTIVRSAPSAPLYFWVLDGWDAELLYQSVAKRGAGSVTTYHNRVKMEVVLDACTKYPIGYAIGDTESPALVTAALRDAVNHTRSLFGRRYKPAQLQMDRAGYKTLLPLYAKTAVHVTPAQVGNAKAKIIEPWFRYFNDAYCHLQPNWSGYGLTARKESQPNASFLQTVRHAFPDRAGVEAQLAGFIEAERARLRGDFLAKWEAMPEANRFPMTDEEYLLTYGVRTEREYLLRPNDGIRFILPGSGVKVCYDSFDHGFRRHAATTWRVVYDPDDLDHALALGDDGRLRYPLERKRVQPMALIERKEGDSEALRRVMDFNREEERRVAETLSEAGVGAPRKLALDPPATPPESIPRPATADGIGADTAERDFGTLSKLLITDSEGNHKRRRDLARLAMEDEAAMVEGGDDEMDISELY
ncbi:MAG: hypothetical protein ACI35Q_09530 [Marinilabiliaceae bacterium]